LRDLKGKKISILSFQDSTYYVLLAALASVGLKKGDVDIQALGAPGVIQEFIDGNVQVCACIPEWIVAAEDAGLRLDFVPVSDYVPILGPSIVTLTGCSRSILTWCGDLCEPRSKHTTSFEANRQRW
jgi:NitT/TauT family transport system substrate-binding protein